MRKQIVCGMLLLILLILPVSVYMQINQSFSLSVENARESSLREEAAISRAMMMEIQQGKSSSSGGRDNTDDVIMKTSQRIARQFGSTQLEILVFLDGTPLTGPLTERTVFLLNAKSRSTYLSSADESLYVVHPLDSRTTLITVSDYSGFYTMRRQQTTYGILLCVGGLVLATILSLLISGRITRRLRILSCAADAVRSGDTFTLEPSAKRDEIARLTNGFISMHEAVEEREESLRVQSSQRQQLIDALAHEMRTPLTSVISAARLIQKDTSNDRMRHEMCDLIVKESRRLSDMDANLMKLTQMNRSELKTESFSLKEMAQEALSVHPDVELSGEDDTVTADRFLIIHLMRNLVSNALKSGTETPVRVTLHPRGFSVSDEGRGMTAEEAAHCRQPFWKADPARTRASGGAGLGLTLCDSIAKLHNAELEIRSAPGKGTAIDFTLPLHPVEDSETANQISCQ